MTFENESPSRRMKARRETTSGRFSNGSFAGRAVCAWAVLCVVILAASGGVPLRSAEAPAADPYSGMEPVLREVLEKFDAAQDSVMSLSATFVERKEIGLLKDTVMQEGRFYHSKPDKFLWEYVAPEPKMLLMNGKRLVAYYPLHKQAEEIQTRLSRRLVKYFGLGQVFADLQQYYTLELAPDSGMAGTHAIVMIPKKKSLAKRLLEVRLWIDDTIQQVRRLEYRELDGDSTLFDFDHIEVNPVIAADRYEIDLPTDVIVSNSFSGFFAEKAR